MENDYKKELEKKEKNPYQEQIEELKAQVADQQKQMQNAYKPNSAYQEQGGYQQSGGGYQNQYGSGGYQRYQGNDVYAKRATQKAYGDYDKQAQVKRRTEGVDLAMSFGTLGAMVFSGQTAAIGGAIASSAGAAGLTSIAALGSLPVAGPLLLGGGAIIGAAVAGYMVLDTVYKGVKGLSSGLSKNNQPIFNRPSFQMPAMQPIRTKDATGKFKELKNNSNKVDGYLKDIKQDFINKKDIGAKIKDVANLKGLTSRQKKEVAGLYGDNIIRNSAKNNDGIVNAYNVKKQIVKDSKEQGWNKSKTAQMVKGVSKRLEVQKDKQNITKDNKVLSIQKADLKTKNKTALNNVKKQTVNSGNSVKAAVNNLNFKPMPQKQPQPQKAQPSKSSSKEIERDR